MFIVRFTIENEEKFYLYYGREGWKEFQKDTFSPLTKDINILEFKLHGKTYQEKKAAAIDLAITWQHEFSYLSWSYLELAEIQGYFERIAKKYGLMKEFKENCIC